MPYTDKQLGMDANITRRDILHGFGALSASALFPGLVSAQTASAIATGVYPPGLTGMRGNHDGAFDVAHALGRDGQTDWGPVKDLKDEEYDLIVVGAGISGLSAAHFYRKDNPAARILILDNHDDFGGHAKRNEFDVNGKTMIGYGGSQTLQEPSSYNKAAKTLLSDLGIEINRFDTAFDHNFFKRHGLKGGLYFNKSKWGVDRLVPLAFDMYDNYIPVADTEMSVEEIVAMLPISQNAQAEFLRLLTTDEDQIPEIKGFDKWVYLSRISYQDFLFKHLNITEKEVFEVLKNLTTDLGVDIASTPAASAISYTGLPGWDAAGLSDEEDETEPYIHHFPDGNASVARLLVRSMIPAAAPGNTMEDIVTARFEYSELDTAESPVRLRLNSTVVIAEHDGDPASAEIVHVTYVQNGKTYRVKTDHCILACFNSIIPQVCPTLPKSQKEALAKQVKSPILYTSVALRNWQAWKKIGYGTVYCPGSYHAHASLDFPVSLGDYAYSAGPDEPIICHMERFPHMGTPDVPDQDQFRAARYELLATPFDDIERSIRTQLAGMLGEAGFDPASDILGITVNRWAHGYSYMYNPMYETYYEDPNDERYPHVQARKQFGRIAIANSDSAARAMLESAVEQGYRAVMEVLTT